MPHDVRIESYGGPRDSLRPLFELADDSAIELDSYIEAGRVLVAISDGEVIGHLQLTGTGDPRQAEIKNMAVRENRQGQGVGRRLIQAAIDLAAAEGVRLILVATAAADIGNLRFYQRQGFRMRSVERDAFTPATGYPPGLLIDGIELRDRVLAGPGRARGVQLLAGDRHDLEVSAADGALEGSDHGAGVVIGPEHVQRLAVLAERYGGRARPRAKVRGGSGEVRVRVEAQPPRVPYRAEHDLAGQF